MYLLLLEYADKGKCDNVFKAEELIKSTIYKKLDKDTQQILLKLSLVDHFTLEQAVYIIEDKKAVDTIKYLQRNNCFIKFDYREKTYTMHTVLKNVLLDEIKFTNIDIEAIYKRCGDCFLEDNDRITAIEYYYKANKPECIIKAIDIEKDGIKYLDECPKFMFEVLSSIPKEQIILNESAYMVYIQSYVFSSNNTDKEEKIQKAVEFVKKEFRDKKFLLGELKLIEGSLVFGDRIKMSKCFKEAYEYFDGKKSLFLNKSTSITLGSPHFSYIYYHDKGKYKEEISYIEDSIFYYNEISDGIGNLVVNIMYAEYFLETGDLKQARVHAEKALYLSQEKQCNSIGLCAIYSLIRICIHTNKIKEYEVYLQKINSMYGKNLCPYENNQIEVMKAYVSSILGKNQEIPGWMLNKEYNNYTIAEVCKNWIVYIVQAVNLINNSKFIELEVHAEIMIEIYSKYKVHLGRIYAFILLAVAKFENGLLEEALHYFNESVELSRDDKVIMPFIELSKYTKGILKLVDKKDLYLKNIISKSNIFINNIEGMIDSKERILTITKRELEVMKYVQLGYKQKQIADKMNISLATVKKHVSFVYSKLNVRNKIEALKILTDNNFI